MRLHLLAMALAMAGPQLASAQTWTQFRGASGNGVCTDGKLPTTWGATQHVAWKTKVPGVGWAQPVVWGDRIFLTTVEGDKQARPRRGDWDPSPGVSPLLRLVGASAAKAPDAVHRWKVLCLDAATGKIVWERTAREGKPTFPIHPNNSYATETPLTDGERLIACFGMTGIYCYDLAGKLLWSKDLESYPTQMDWGGGSSPVLLGDHVYLQCDNEKSSFIAALDKTSGQEKWRAAREEKSNWATPHVWRNRQRTELVTAGGAKMRSYEPASGKLLWEMTASGRTSSTPVSDGELLFVDSYDRLTGREGILAAIRAGASGDISLKAGKSSNDFVAWSQRVAGTRSASPLVYDGCVYVLGQMQGIVRCYDAATGKEHYRERLPGVTGCTSSPWAGGGHVFCLQDDGTTVVLRAGPKFEVVASNALPEMFWASAAVHGDKLLLRGADHLYCIAR